MDFKGRVRQWRAAKRVFDTHIHAVAIWFAKHTPSNEYADRQPDHPLRRWRHELNIPSDSLVIYSYQYPELSRANPSTNSIVLRQGGVEVRRITIYRADGINGDKNDNLLFPFKMRGGVNAYGNVMTGSG